MNSSVEALQKPHVETIENGLRMVDVRNFSTLAEVKQFLENFDLWHVGHDSIILKSTQQDQRILRMQVVNQMGQEWNSRFIQKLQSSRRAQYKRNKGSRSLGDLLEDVFEYVNYAHHSSSESILKTHKEIKERAAGHNAQFCRDPASTVPVNEIISFQDQYFGVLMKYLDGKEGTGKDFWELRFSVDDLERITWDDNPDNVIFHIAATCSPLSPQIIDFEHFIASSKHLPTLPREKNNYPK